MNVLWVLIVSILYTFLNPLNVNSSSWVKFGKYKVAILKVRSKFLSIWNVNSYTEDGLVVTELLLLTFTRHLDIKIKGLVLTPYHISRDFSYFWKTVVYINTWQADTYSIAIRASLCISIGTVDIHRVFMVGV